ncbi:hypothetical protein P154DRAFT_31026 [Amniculicola lignicola CBS 123094]|uniref:Uncharacterized protein n=1 Tax=Amniculicola lignicola CBS 123094 TaxID=1392246 RepID=A0A6A5W9W3_9PLEO|nr:hypothetical protein P154DRAFT_31026 [Amniculicola lignicola CBS 123094]
MRFSTLPMSTAAEQYRGSPALESGLGSRNCPACISNLVLQVKSPCSPPATSECRSIFKEYARWAGSRASVAIGKADMPVRLASMAIEGRGVPAQPGRPPTAVNSAHVSLSQHVALPRMSCSPVKVVKGAYGVHIIQFLDPRRNTVTYPKQLRKRQAGLVIGPPAQPWPPRNG